MDKPIPTGDPQTPEEWQWAVDMGRALVLVEAARVYGFVTGGPDVIHDNRIEEVTRRAAAIGIHPHDDNYCINLYLSHENVPRAWRRHIRPLSEADMEARSLPESGGWVIIRADTPALSAPAKSDTDNEVGHRLLQPIPVASVHWAYPSTILRYARRQRKTHAAFLETELSPDDYMAEGIFGGEPNWSGAMVIRWDNAEVRLFPHEAVPMIHKGLRAFLHSEAYELVPGDVATRKILKAVLDGETRPIYEAALIDGCTHEQALAVAMEQDILSESVPEPLGWYRLLPPYTEFFS